MSIKRNRGYWVFSLFMFSLFISYSFVYAMYAIWLSQDGGLKGTDIGFIFSINAAAAMALQPVLGFIQDKIHEKQYLLWLNVIMLIVAGPFFSLIYKPLLLQFFYFGVVLGALYIALSFLAIAGAVETYVERASRLNGIEYGQIRTWGSLGWATAAFFTGTFFNIDPNLNFWMASAIAVVPLCVLIFVKIPVPQEAVSEFSRAKKVVLSDVLNILKLKDFHFLTLYVFGVASVYVVYEQQFPVYFASVYPTIELGNQMYGYLNSVQIFLEAAGFFCAPWLVNKIGLKNGLLLAGSIMVARILGSGLTDSYILISMIKLLHAAELPILMVSMFKYINNHFDDHLSSTLYLVGFAFVTQVGTIMLSPIAGHYYDLIGFGETYLAMSLVALFFLVLSAKFLLTDDRQPYSKIS